LKELPLFHINAVQNCWFRDQKIGSSVAAAQQALATRMHCRGVCPFDTLPWDGYICPICYINGNETCYIQFNDKWYLTFEEKQ
jgi:hypothetical protein